MAQAIIIANRHDRPPDLERAELLDSRTTERPSALAEAGRNRRGAGPRMDTSAGSVPSVAERGLDGDSS
jgi:hypothetical protein